MDCYQNGIMGIYFFMWDIIQRYHFFRGSYRCSFGQWEGLELDPANTPFPCTTFPSSLAFQDIPGSPSVFSASALESTLSPEALAPFVDVIMNDA